MIASVDVNTCTGCGLCADICPEIFEIKSDVATVKVSPVPEKAETTCREAAESCPVEAISLKD